MGLKSNNSAVAFAIQSGGRGTYNEPNNTTDLAAGLANLRPNITAVTVADDSYTGGVFRNADAVAGKRVAYTFDMKLKPPASLPAANAFVLGRLLQAAKMTEVRTATAIPASAEAVGGSGNTTTALALGSSGSSTDDIYNGFPVLISDNGSSYKQRLTTIRDYTGSTKLAELMETLGAAPAANWQIPTFIGYFMDFSSAEPPVLSGKIWIDGVLTELMDVGVTGIRFPIPTSNTQQAQFPRVEFTVEGTIVDTTDESTPTIPSIGPAPVLKDGDVWLHKQRVGTSDVTFDLGLQTEHPPNANQADGSDAPEIAGGTISVNLTMQKYRKATLDSLGLAEAQAYHPLFMQWGNGAWNTVQMFVRDGRFNFPNDDLSGLTAMQQLSLFVDVRDRNFGIVFPGS